MININPLANQKRSYRFLVLFSILSVAILAGWILAQLISPKQSASDSVEEYFQIEKELTERTFTLFLDWPGPNHKDRAHQLNVISRKLEVFEQRLQQTSETGNIDSHAYRQFQKRSKRLKSQLLFLMEEDGQNLRSSHWKTESYMIPLQEETSVYMRHRPSCISGQQWEKKRQCLQKYYLPRH